MNNRPNRVCVASVTDVAANVKRFELVGTGDRVLPPFSPGAHIIVTMRNDDCVFRNAYSIVSETTCGNGYVISVQRSPESRGGSAFLHTQVKPGSELEISDPVNLFPVAQKARKHILIAGGIGITPMLAMLDAFKKNNSAFELHYAIRAPDLGAYYSELANTSDPRVRVYRSDQGERIPLASIIENQPLGTHIYVCGPQRMIDWVLDLTKREGWPEENLHWEHFSAPPPGNRFDVKLARSGKIISVGEHQSMLEAIEQAGVEAPYLCRGGACGQCVTEVVSIEAGSLQHNDHYLTDREKAEGKQIAICVSRADGGCITVEL